MSESIDPVKRFSSRVENYLRYRPGYPAGVLEHLRQHRVIRTGDVIADIGCGTGLLADLFLDTEEHDVIGVEPNDEMRQAGETRLGRFGALFRSVKGTAEATTLPDASVDAVVAGQAFHWFDAEKAARELTRILKPGRCVTLVWNERRTGSTPFLRDYERLLKNSAPDYEQVLHRHVDLDAICEVFRMSEVRTALYDNKQVFNLEALIGRARSSSYVPNVDDPGHDEFMQELTRLFEEHQRQGTVAFEYDTRMYYGVPGSAS